MNTMKTNVLSYSTGALALGLYLTALTWAAPGPAAAGPGQRGQGHRKTPQAAVDACQGKKADDVCQVALGDTKLSGKCAARGNAPLACRPDRAAVAAVLADACKGKKESDACSVQMGERKIEGQCHKTRGDSLVCRRAKHD